MPFDKSKPYNDLPPLPPAGISLETPAILKQTVAASRALAELKGGAQSLPNQAILIRLIGLQEAKYSSEIENIVTTNDELYRAYSEFTDLESLFDPATKEVLSYHRALWHGFARLQEGIPFATRFFEEIVQIIKNSPIGIRKTTGTVIANTNRDVIYTPPEGESIIRNLLGELENFLHAEDDIDPLIKMAIAHYQFEAIHPFADGNGRTGRILNILFLIYVDLLDIPILYLSRYIIENKGDYYEGLRDVTEKESWENWILFMLRAITKTSQDTYKSVQDVRLLMQETTDIVRDELPKIYSKDLIEILFSQPYCKIRFLEDAGIAKRQTASLYLQELTRIGVLQRIDKGRDAYFIHTKFLDILTR
jgi:Fic family protein